MTTEIKEKRTQETCTKALIPVRDALDILSGKWKLPIIIALSFLTITGELIGQARITSLVLTSPIILNIFAA